MKIIGIPLFCFFLIFPLVINYDLLAQQVSIESKILSKNSEIQRLVNEKKDTIHVIRKIKKNEYRVLELLKVINDNIQKTKARIRRLGLKKDKILNDIKKTKGRIKYLAKMIEQDKISIQKKLYAIFYIKKIRDLTPMLGLKTFEHYYRNKYLIEKSAVIDVQLLNKYQDNQNLFKEQRIRQGLQHTEYLTLISQEKEQNELLSFEKTQQNTYLNHIQEDQVIRTKYLREIQIEIEKLNNIIFQLENKKNNEKKAIAFQGFRDHKNDLPVPVKGKLIQKFRAKNTIGKSLFKRGLLIETQVEEEALSILEGKIVFVGPFRGYQKLIILDHGKGCFSVYGNLNETLVQIGDIVDPQIPLGIVGIYGAENRSLFYFETRYNKTAINPMQLFPANVWKR
jgi:murein hydrolase activator